MTGDPSILNMQGWRQFLAVKEQMLYQYEVAKKFARSDIVVSSHGNVAEALFRNWLAEFLPKRFGVTSGRLIRQRLEERPTYPKYDIIIYDQLASPVLWSEDDPDRTGQGRLRAIPVEHVHAVLEVKSSLEPTTAAQALRKLEELRPLLASVDDPQEPYRAFLPPSFFCTTVFFELRKEHEGHAAALDNLVPDSQLRGYSDGVILSAETLNSSNCGLLKWVSIGDGEKPYCDWDKATLDSGHASRSVHYDGAEFQLWRMWSPGFFATFAFDMVARLQGTYNPNRASSFHGLCFGSVANRKEDT